VGNQYPTLRTELIDKTDKLTEVGRYVQVRVAEAITNDPALAGKPEQLLGIVNAAIKLQKEKIDLYMPIPNTEVGQKVISRSITILSSPGDPDREKELRQVATWLQNMKPGDAGTMEELLNGLALSKEKKVSIQARMSADDIKHLTPVQKLQLIYSGLLREKDAVPPKAAPRKSIGMGGHAIDRE
jgi:hypothetical protein